jgi:hypothetical protein
MADPKAATVEVEPLSMVCTRMPPDLTGHGDDEVEWFVRLGPAGARRRLAPGDHVEPGHPLVTLFGDCFAPSAELVNVTCLSTPTPEVQARRTAERARLLPRLAEVRQSVCLNCLATSPPSPPIEPEVQAVDVASALDTAEADQGERERVRFYAYGQQRRRLAALRAAERLAAEFRLQHAQCDPSRELHPPEEMPARDPSGPIPVWSGPFSLRAGDR